MAERERKDHEPIVELRAVTKSYSQGSASVEVLRGADLTVHAGEFVAILGPSGSGKTTLLNLIGMMDKPSSGEIRVLGKHTAGLSERHQAKLRNRGLGFVFQFDSLLSEFSVLENVTLPGRIGGIRGPKLEAHARELLETLGIASLRDRFPTQLSGGERQRAAIARALINRPSLLLADEPTGNLDRQNAEAVFDQLKVLCERFRVAVLMVTHNEGAASFSTRAIHLRDGRILEN
ncbi:MAG: hypothetical protein A2X36_15975 [Elusimicrobia bacterium GWA2_69_24]|nr:MAG: hypothetical protein A2X36_15975 [Elusimicrobia bacterium GWA2_69_24]HBL16602.1 hypothetical protein [Elusimicrobiota bacterium]